MMLQLLQMKGNQPPPFGGPGGAQAAPDPAAVMMMLVVYGLILVVGLVISIFFYLSLSKCLKQVKPRNRKMEPGQVWLNFIPIFNYVWIILTFLKIADSLKNEYEDRGLRGDGDYGKTMGIATYVSMWVCGCVSPILFIIYWVKIAGYTKELIADSEGGRGSRRSRDDDDDEEDDRPRRRSRGRDDDDDDEDDRPRRR